MENPTTYTYTKVCLTPCHAHSHINLPETFATFFASNSRFKKIQLWLAPRLRRQCQAEYEVIRNFVLRFQKVDKTYEEDGWDYFVPAPLSLTQVIGEDLQVREWKTIRRAKKVLMTISRNLPDFNVVESAFSAAKESAQEAWLKKIEELLTSMPRMFGYDRCNQATLFLREEGRNIWAIKPSDHLIQDHERSLNHIRNCGWTPATTVMGFYHRSL